MACKTKAEYLPLDQITRPNLKTEEAAYYLNIRPQTLRVHACMDKGAIRPLRINGRLAWPVDALRKLLGVS
ncbi:MAG: DNA-binding protein [Alcaligenaceae bacterium]|nr:MAG: DNA-binding protein [Alcaligenaceae bacterium]